MRCDFNILASLLFILNGLFGAASRKTIMVPLHKINFLRSLTRPLLIPVFFCGQTRKQKTPPKRGFYQGFAVGCRRTHCVTSTQKSIRDRRRTRNSGTDFDVFEYGSPFDFCPKKHCSCIQYLSILRMFAVSEGAAVLPAQRSPG